MDNIEMICRELNTQWIDNYKTHIISRKDLFPLIIKGDYNLVYIASDPARKTVVDMFNRVDLEGVLQVEKLDNGKAIRIWSFLTGVNDLIDNDEIELVEKLFSLPVPSSIESTLKFGPITNFKSAKDLYQYINNTKIDTEAEKSPISKLFEPITEIMISMLSRLVDLVNRDMLELTRKLIDTSDWSPNDDDGFDPDIISLSQEDKVPSISDIDWDIVSAKQERFISHVETLFEDIREKPDDDEIKRQFIHIVTSFYDIIGGMRHKNKVTAKLREILNDREALSDDPVVIADDISTTYLYFNGLK